MPQPIEINQCFAMKMRKEAQTMSVLGLKITRGQSDG
jgi:hypothetical protein